MNGNFYFHAYGKKAYGTYGKNGLLIKIKIKQHLPLEKPFNFIQIVIEVSIRKSFVINFWKRNVSSSKF